MKYMLIVIEAFDVRSYAISTTSDEIVFVSFPAEIGNPNYDAFLVQVDLTDKQVHALTPDVWYDFHEGTV